MVVEWTAQTELSTAAPWYEVLALPEPLISHLHNGL